MEYELSTIRLFFKYFKALFVMQFVKLFTTMKPLDNKGES